MEQWIELHIDRRREELHEEAALARVIRVLESGRSSRVRGLLADAAERVADALAHLARRLRSSRVCGR